MLYRVWNGVFVTEAMRFCFVVADTEDEAIDLAQTFFWRMDIEYEPGRCRAIRQQTYHEMEIRLIELERKCTMSNMSKTIPTIPEGFPPADKADKLTPEQMLDLMDNHHMKVREIAECYDGLTWQKVSIAISKLKGTYGQNKKPRKASEPPEQGLEPEVAAELEATPASLPVRKPKKLRPTAFAGEVLEYRLEDDRFIMIGSISNEIGIPISALDTFIDELTELKEQLDGDAP
jgi:hypothetical protein